MAECDTIAAGIWCPDRACHVTTITWQKSLGCISPHQRVNIVRELLESRNFDPVRLTGA